MNSVIRYSIVILCLCIYLVRHIHSLHTSDVRYLLSAFVFSAVADYYLVFTDYYPTGLLFFCLAQCCYCHILKYPILSFLQNGLLGCIGIWICSLFWPLPLDITVLMAAFYFFCLVTNVWLAWKKSSPGFSRSFALAITLLLLCDIHVGLYNLPFYLSIPSDSFLGLWCEASPNIIWCFYLPAQFIFSLQFPEKKVILFS